MGGTNDEWIVKLLVSTADKSSENEKLKGGNTVRVELTFAPKSISFKAHHI
jgi:hypothetical protein